VTATLPTAADVIEWDVENWSTALDYWPRHTALGLRNRRVLEIGSRRGGLSLWLAANGATVVCSDVAGPAEEAMRKHWEFGVSDRVSYAAVDALRMDYAGEFDIVVFKSVLGALGSDLRRQEAALARMHKALRPGGELWFAENLAASPVHRALRSRYVSWAGHWHYATLPELRRWLSMFPSVSMTTCGVLGALGRSERQRRTLARLDKLFLNVTAPRAWHYVAVGVARKQPAITQ
jgi:SAM-dependent methyltransferase